MFLTRVGDIAEVFDCVVQLQHTRVLVRAAHNRSLDAESERLWQKLESQFPEFWTGYKLDLLREWKVVCQLNRGVA